MKKLIFALSICLAAIGLLGVANISTAQEQASDCGCVADALADVQKLKTGGTRKDLRERFTTEGGLSTVRARTFVYRKCSYIKIDVTFKLTDKDYEEDRPGENPTDKIVTISRPYLEYGVID